MLYRGCVYVYSEWWPLVAGQFAPEGSHNSVVCILLETYEHVLLNTVGNSESCVHITFQLVTYLGPDS